MIGINDPIKSPKFRRIISNLSRRRGAAWTASEKVVKRQKRFGEHLVNRGPEFTNEAAKAYRQAAPYTGKSSTAFDVVRTARTTNPGKWSKVPHIPESR